MTTSDQTKVGSARRDRSHAVLWAFAALVVAALVVGAIIATLRGSTALDPTTPEGVVQAYLQAVLDRDHAEAITYLSEETAARCPASAFREAWVPEDIAADLEDVSVQGDDARVRVRLRQTADPLQLGGDAFASTEAFTLVNDNGIWRLTGDPWPLYSCEEPR